MHLVEQHIINYNNSLFKELDNLCFLSKNLYNKSNYIVRQEFIKTFKEKEEGKIEHVNWIRYYELQKQLQNNKDFDYYQLPTKVSQHVLKTLDKNWKSFFKSVKDFKTNSIKYKGKPKLPNYKHKTKGRNILIYTIQAISKKELKNNVIYLSGTNIKIKTKQKNIKQVRIVPRNKEYLIEIIYKKEVNDLKLNKNNIAGIDLGINNLCAITSNQNNIKPLLINGRPLKSINQYYNKKKSKLQSFAGDKSSNRLINLTNKRNKKVNNYLHNTSRYVINYLIRNNIGNLVIGKNKLWKTDCNIGKKNNQNFVNIPHAKLINMIEYKCFLVGINVFLTEESYTSKCSFIDNEELKHHDKYQGRRKHRGLFFSKENIMINADCNGSGNMIRKAFPNAFADGIEGVVVHPVRVIPYKLAS
jgi:putative transposase